MAALPPGPKVGFLQSLSYLRDPFAYYRQLRERYGDPITVPTTRGTVVVTGHPEGIRDVFSARPDTFAPWGTDALEPLTGEQAIFSKEGAEHQALRRLMMPPFHGERMHAYGHLFQEVTKRHAARLTPGRPFLMQDLAAAITLEAIIRAIFGVLDGADAERWTVALLRLIDAVDPASIFFPFLRHEFGGIGPWAKFVAARDAVDRMIADMLAERRATGERGDDILSLLMEARYEDGEGMSDSELRDQLVSLLVAGHETTSAALAWTFYWLDRHPEVRSTLISELQTLGDAPDPMALARLPYLDAVCNEALRLNPIVPDVYRTLRKPLTVRGWEVPAGLAVGVSIFLAHTNPEIYPDPEAFQPERFLDRTYSPFEFMPFGGGFRRCIGSAFAMYEMKTVVATLLTGYEMHLTTKDEIPPARRNVTMGPRGGVEMVLHGAAVAR
jgi:cytochrome P450